MAQKNEKICSKCKIEKPKSAFSNDRGNKDGLKFWCKICSVRYNKEYRNTPRGREVQRNSIKKHKKTPKGKETQMKRIREYKRTPKGINSRLKRVYGITLEEYNIILEAQGGVCAICGTDNPCGVGGFHIDHIKGIAPPIIRGLLCMRCNTKLEWYINNRANIFKYLKESVDAETMVR